MIKNYVIIISIVIILFMPIIFIAQIPEEEFTEFTPTGVTDELQEARDILVEVMAGTSMNEEFVNIFDDIPITAVGIMERNGEKMLYLGIYDDVFYENQSFLKETLHERFPGIDIFFEPKDFARSL